MRMGKSSGITQLEFAVVAAVFAMLAGVLVSALLYYEELAEKTVVEVTIVNMRTGLRLKVAELIIKGRESEIAGLAHSNPVTWLDHPPSGYQDRFGAALAGDWVYHPVSKEIEYRPRLRAHLSIQSGTTLRWKLMARRVSATGVAEGVEIVQVTPYQWF